MPFGSCIFWFEFAKRDSLEYDSKQIFRKVWSNLFLSRSSSRCIFPALMLVFTNPTFRKPSSFFTNYISDINIFQSAFVQVLPTQCSIMWMGELLQLLSWHQLLHRRVLLFGIRLVTLLMS